MGLGAAEEGTVLGICQTLAIDQQFVARVQGVKAVGEFRVWDSMARMTKTYELLGASEDEFSSQTLNQVSCGFSDLCATSPP